MSGSCRKCRDTFPKANKSQANKKNESVLYASASKCNKEDTHPSLQPCFVPLEKGIMKKQRTNILHLADPWASNLIQGLGCGKEHTTEVFSNGPIWVWSFSPLEWGWALGMRMITAFIGHHPRDLSSRDAVSSNMVCCPHVVCGWIQIL